MADFTENELRDIERARDLPPDEPYPSRECEHGYTEGCPDCDSPTYMPAVFSAPVDPVILYAEARAYLADAVSYLEVQEGAEGIDPEEALRCAREGVARIEALL